MEQGENLDTAELLNLAAQGNRQAVEQLFVRTYDELHRMARRQMAGERQDHSLQPTALLNELYLRLVGQDELAVQSRTHFRVIAAETMRRILIEFARKRGTAKRGGGWHRITLEPSISPSEELDIDLLALNAALEKLTGQDARMGRVVELRFFGGLTVEEVAQSMDLSRRTVEKDWTFARAWLRRELDSPPAQSS